METKNRVSVKIVILCAVLAVLLIKPGYYFYREMDYVLGDSTQAEQVVYNYAKAAGIPYGVYPRNLISLLETCPEAETFVLNYPRHEKVSPDLSGYDRKTVPLFLQWDPMWGYEKYGSSYLAVTGCGPTCLAMAGFYLTGEEAMNPMAIAEFAEKNGYYAKGYGSSWTLISEGAEKLGLSVKELPLVKKKIVDTLDAGNPVILALGKGDFTTTGHYVVLTGVTDGAFQVNDPNSPVRSEKLWTYEELEHQIRNIWAIGKQ